MKKMLNRLLYGFLLSLVGVFFFTLPAAFALPYISSASYCLVDAESGQVILSRQAEQMRPVASTTKMMTAILAREYAGLDEVAVISSHAARTPEYSIGLREGQEILMAELLKVALIRSANDAAVVLAEHVAGEEEFFAHLMSKKAFAIGAVNTHFRNASGLPDPDHYSSAYDLCRIGHYLLGDEHLSSLVSSRQLQFKHPGYRQAMTINNTNVLLGSYPGADGIKTGTTNAAGKCLVASASRDGRRLIAVALKSANRAGDCRVLLDYGFNSSQLVKVVDKNTPFKEIKLSGSPGGEVEVYPAGDIRVWSGSAGPDIQKRVEVQYEVSPPLRAGQKLGTLSVYADNRLVEETELVCRQSVRQEAGPARRILQKLRAL